MKVIIEKKERKGEWNGHGKHNVIGNGGKKSKEKICPRCKNQKPSNKEYGRCSLCGKPYY